MTERNDKLTSLSVPGEHNDLIHDIAYDFHGRRIATCSSDQNVRVWDLNEHGRWIVSSSWKTHNGPVWRVAWAHPEFGQVLATCSFDRTASIWEEVATEGNPDKKTIFCPRAKLVDSRSNVTDVKFAPRHLGLLLATCSQNGILRIYEAADIMKLSEWNLQQEVNVFKSRCGCLSWSSSKYDPPLIAVGCDDPNTELGEKVAIFEMNESSRKWSKVTNIMVCDPVYDVKFASNNGRSYHLLAVACKDLKIFSVRCNGGDGKYDCDEIACLDEHNGQVWRLSWNITGTVLASSGADGIIKLSKANYGNNWKCVDTIRSDDKGNVFDTSTGLKIDTSDNGGYW